MGTAPRRRRDESHLLVGGRSGEHRGEILDPHLTTRGQVVQHPGERHLPKAPVVAVHLAIGGDGDERSRFARPLRRQQARGEGLAVLEQIAE